MSSSSSSPQLSKETKAMLRRMVSFPKAIIGTFSRAVDQGIDLITSPNGRRNHQHHHHLLHPPPPPVPGHPFFPPLQVPSRLVEEDPWGEFFLPTFEQFYGTTHPFFYACRFTQALKIARDEQKLLFFYLHRPRDADDFTASFCRETLCSQVVVEFLDVNFVSWGGLADRGEGLEMGRTLKPGGFPFCAVIAPAPPCDEDGDDSIVVLQQIEGPVSPAEMLEILQRTMEEHRVAASRSLHPGMEEQKLIDRKLREEQDAGYLASLRIDQENERQQNPPPTCSSSAQANKVQKVGTPAAVTVTNAKHKSLSAMFKKAKEATTAAVVRSEDRKKETKGKDKQMSQLLIRFPNGERREQAFSTKDKVKEIFRFVDSLGLVSEGTTYRLVSSFPRKVYGVNGEMNVSIKDAGLYPRATVFIEPL